MTRCRNPWQYLTHCVIFASKVNRPQQPVRREVMPSTADQGNQFMRKTLEAIGLWSETNMQVMRQLLDCSASTAREGLSLSTELQTSILEATKQGQSYMLQQLHELPDAP